MRAISDPTELFDFFAVAWTRPEWTPTQMRFYADELVDVPFIELVDAVRYLARTQETWRPDVAMICRAVVERRGLFPSLAEAGATARQYTEIQAAYRAGQTCHLFPIVHPLVRDAAVAAGVDSMGAFAKAYRELVDGAFRQIQSAPLSEPVEYRPVRVARDHTPPELVWRRHGWWTPAGVLHQADSGDRYPGRVGVDDHPALTTGGAG